jgi:hypothetical protein
MFAICSLAEKALSITHMIKGRPHYSHQRTLARAEHIEKADAFD